MRALDDRVLDAFRAVAPAVEAFAGRRELRIDRYPRGKPAWELRFARRQGGEAAIVLSYREPGGHVLDVSAVWWVDDFTDRTRRLHSEKIGAHYRRDAVALLQQSLEEAFARIGRWTETDLGPPHGPYRDWAGKTTQTLAAERARLPRH